MSAHYGWYPDPERPGMLRWWNGEAWLDRWQPGTSPKVVERHPDEPHTTSKAQKQRVKRLRSGVLVVALIALLVISAAFANSSPGSQTAIARDLMLEACRESVAIQTAAQIQQVVGKLTESSPFTRHVRFEGTHPGGAWECWGSLDDNELGIHYRFNPALPVPTT